MISEFLLNIVFGIVNGLLVLVPDISWSVDTSWMSAFVSVLKMVFYLLPMHTVIQIITLIIALTIFRFIISLIKTIWELLPVL